MLTVDPELINVRFFRLNGAEVPHQTFATHVPIVEVGILRAVVRHDAVEVASILLVARRLEETRGACAAQRHQQNFDAAP